MTTGEDYSALAENTNRDSGQYSPEDMKKALRELQRRNRPGYLPTISMPELYEEIFPGKVPILEGILFPGTFLLAGAPKIGKSFLVMQMAYHVSTGTSLWGLPVSGGPVLYLSLEDDMARLQRRLYRMFGDVCSDQLHFSISAGFVGTNLIDQLQFFLEEYPKTRLIIIDTLQKVREVKGEQYSYSSDYDLIVKLKALSDKKGICILLVHHTRKQSAEDPLETVSGTTGLTGAADGILLLAKVRRTDEKATLTVTGRDIPDQRYYLLRNREHLTWDLEKTEVVYVQEPPDPILESAAGLLSPEHPSWCGTAKELAEVLGSPDSPISLSMRLTAKAGQLESEFGVRMSRTRSRDTRMIRLERIEA